MTTPQYYRTLAWLESFLVDIDAVVIGVCEFESVQRFDKERLESALQQCINHHPNLRLNIATFTKPYYFFQTKQSCSTPTYIELESKDEWQRIVDDELNTPFEFNNEAKGLLKLFVLYDKDPTSRRQYLLLKYHHSIADGTSGMILLNTLLSCYFNRDQKLSTLSSLSDSETLAFPQVTNEDEKKTEDMIQTILAYKRQWKPMIPYEPATGRNLTIYHHGTPENMAQLLNRCRQEKVTIGSVLLTSIYFAIAELVKDTWLHDASSYFSNFKFDLDVNLRHRYPSPLDRHEHIGLHIGMMTLNEIVISRETKFWSLCRVIFNDLQRNLSEGRHLTYLRANRLTSTDEQIDEQTKRNDGRINDLNFSNIGPYVFQREYEDLKLKHYYCVGSNPCPSVGTNVILVCSVESLDYVLLHEAGEKNRLIAKSWFDRMVGLTDRVWRQTESWTFDHFLKEST
ncbi:unnamed protein product [Adineta ricciae]|uniref:Condensation domain-containing protein n=1 Tax=Adineta ricciae TaxID=249248 RepID=A0A815IZW3_ADIRI|nr:unnamed protein product [Adineta ricciae]CAF1375721.1 unnamed protein product [Adineta ricciae]